MQHHEILKSDGDPAPGSVQEEVKIRREARTTLEHSGMGDCQAKGAAERVDQACREQVEHATGVISKYVVGAGGRTGYERAMGTPCSHEIVEVGQTSAASNRRGPKHMRNTRKAHAGGRIRLGREYWRTGKQTQGTQRG